MTSALTPDEREQLVEERDFLLRSLEDLEAEHDAGDVDEADYLALKDDYTRRAAATIRTLGAKQVERPARRGLSRSALLWSAGVVLFAVLAGVLVARSSGRRSAEDGLTGEVSNGVLALIDQAQTAANGGDLDRAIELYSNVLEQQPSNVEALTYRGWLRFQAGELTEGRADIDKAVQLEPTYPDAHIFKALLFLRDKRPDEAINEFALVNLDRAPPEVKVLMRNTAEGLAESQQVDASLRLFDVLLKHNPRDHETLAERGWVLGRTAQSVLDAGGDKTRATQLLESARRSLDQAVEIDPTYPNARVYRAFVAFAQGSKADADADLRVFDGLPNRPPELVELVAAFGLREAIKK